MFVIDRQVPVQIEKRATCVVGLMNWYSKLATHNVEMTQLKLKFILDFNWMDGKKSLTQW